MDDTHAVAAWSEGLLKTLRLARAMVGAGRAVALDGLADQVGFLCAKVMDLPPDQGRQLRPKLASILAEAESITLALQARMGEPGTARAF